MDVQKSQFALWYFVYGILEKLNVPFSNCLEIAGRIPGLSQFSCNIASEYSGDMRMGDIMHKSSTADGLALPPVAVKLMNWGSEFSTLVAFVLSEGDRTKLREDFYRLVELDEAWVACLKALRDQLLLDQDLISALSSIEPSLEHSEVFIGLARAMQDSGQSLKEAIQINAAGTPLNHPVLCCILAEFEQWCNPKLVEILDFLVPKAIRESDHVFPTGLTRTWIEDLTLLRIYSRGQGKLSDEEALIAVARYSKNRSTWDSIREDYPQRKLSELFERMGTTPLANPLLLDQVRSAENGDLGGHLSIFLPDKDSGAVLSEGLPMQLYVFSELISNHLPILDSLRILNTIDNELCGVINRYELGYTLSEAIDPINLSRKRDENMSWIENPLVYKFIRAGERTGQLPFALKFLCTRFT